MISSKDSSFWISSNQFLLEIFPNSSFWIAPNSSFSFPKERTCGTYIFLTTITTLPNPSGLPGTLPVDRTLGLPVRYARVAPRHP